MNLDSSLVAYFERLQRGNDDQTLKKRILRALPGTGPDQENVLNLVIEGMQRLKDSMCENHPNARHVLTTPEGLPMGQRLTKSILHELVGLAEKNICIAGFAITGQSGLIALMAERMREKPFLKARFLCSNWEQDDGQGSVDAIRETWPKDLRKPEIYRQTTDFSGSIMHIKTVITDDTRMIIGSANFTKAGLNKNLELGILLEGPFVAKVSGTLADLAKSPFFEKVRLA